MFSFSRYSLTRQFMMVSFVILLMGMAIIGFWVGEQIENGVINRTAAVTSLYVDSFVSPHLQDLATNNSLKQEDVEALDKLLEITSLGRQIASFKVWSSDGHILYSPNPDLIGKQFEFDADLAKAFSGQVVSEMSDLREPENEYEIQIWDELIETYLPIRAVGSGAIIAVAEFYQTPDDLRAEVRATQFQSWLVVGLATVTMYLLLTGLVSRASNTILVQQSELQEKVSMLSQLLQQNERLNERVRRAASRTTALNERTLRRISADLHDGPGQDMALALMRVESLIEDEDWQMKDPVKGDGKPADMQVIHSALDSALKDLRLISRGLRLPELEDLNSTEVARRAVRDYKRKTGRTVRLDVGKMPEIAPLSVKITMYRIIQEALANSFRHAGTAEQSVKVWLEDESLHAEVEDSGIGFDLDADVQNGRLGLRVMRERVELLGGSFEIETTPDEGTRIHFSLPLQESDSSS